MCAVNWLEIRFIIPNLLYPNVHANFDFELNIKDFYKIGEKFGCNENMVYLLNFSNYSLYFKIQQLGA